MAQGRAHAGSVGHVPRDLTLPPVMDRGNRERRLGEVREESHRRDPVLGTDTGEGPSLLQIPLCVTAGPSEEEDPSLHRPTLVDATCNLDRRPRNEGVWPKAGPRFSTGTIAEEARALQGGTDFYLPLPGQPKISEVSSWRAPIQTEQGNPGIYVQVDEWKDKYGGNMYVVDEVTGRIYVLRGDVMERVPKWPAVGEGKTWRCLVGGVWSPRL